jgi:hypothetical protein
MGTLFLHAGHPKTGSSYLQHVLRSNKQVLAKHGIRYAIGNDAAIAPGASISNGNGAQLFDSRETFSVSLRENRTADGLSLLYSSEATFVTFIGKNAADYLEEVARLHGFDRVKILIFIRNPVSLFCSVWQEKIKAHGGTDIEFADIEKNILHGTRWIFLLERWLDRLERCPAVDLTFVNYSSCAEQLLERFAEWLEIPAGTLDPTSLKRVNRSMSYSELHFIVALNRILGETRILSNPLCEKLTDLLPDMLEPPLEVQRRLWEHVEPVISRINARLPEGSRYQCDIRPPEARPTELRFSLEQIRVIAESLGNEILQSRQELATRREEIDRLKGEVIHLTEMLERERNLR